MKGYGNTYLTTLVNNYSTNVYKNYSPMPTDLQGWHGDDLIFKDLIDKNVKTIVEVGSWKGLSTTTMAKILKENGSGIIYAVDTWLGSIEFMLEPNTSIGLGRDLRLNHGYPSIYYQFISNVINLGLQDYIIPIPNTSVNGFKYLKANNISPDLIYIDASHEYEDVLTDIINYYSILKQGGKIFGDDYDNHYPGVVDAVNKFVFDNNLKLNIERYFWIIEKI